ncbi:response regulator [Microbacteriaceae bacterium 4G12]
MIKVLIVEDDPMVAEFNKRYLNQVEGFELIDVASSVKEAIKVLDTTVIDLILLDVYMPEQTGFELLTHIRNAEKSVDVILITAARDMCSVKKAMQYGAIDYLIKPFEFERFNEALSAYREKATFMGAQQTVSQEVVDKMFLAKDQGTCLADLPKGLTRKTLVVVWESILAMEGRTFSTEELASQLGISRVSIRKYLNFLEDIGILEVEIGYGVVGRPITKYQCMEENSDVIKQYL